MVTVGEQPAMYICEVRPPASLPLLSALIVSGETNPTWMVGTESPNVIDSYDYCFVSCRPKRRGRRGADVVELADRVLGLDQEFRQLIVGDAHIRQPRGVEQDARRRRPRRGRHGRARWRGARATAATAADRNQHGLADRRLRAEQHHRERESCEPGSIAALVSTAARMRDAESAEHESSLVKSNHDGFVDKSTEPRAYSPRRTTRRNPQRSVQADSGRARAKLHVRRRADPLFDQVGGSTPP